MAETNAGRTRLWWILGGGLAILLAGAYVILAAWQSTTTPAHARVLGTDLGGLSKEDAVSTLEGGLGDVPVQPVTLAVGEATVDLAPAEAGMAVDVDGTVDSLLRFSLDPRVLWARQFADVQADPVLDFDDEALTPVLQETAADLTQDPVDALLAFDEEGAAIVTEGADGLVVTESALRTALADQWLRTDDAVVVEPAHTEPDITTAEAEEARSAIAEPAVSAPIDLTATAPDDSTHTLTVTPETIAAQLAFEPERSELVPVFDGEALTDAVFDDNPEVGAVPRNAGVEIRDGAVEIVPSEQGWGADPEEMADAVTVAMTTDDRTADIDLEEVDPDFTTEDAKKADFSDTVAKFSTPYSSSPNRDTNLRVATDQVRGTVLLPGEQFSLNDTLGRRTAANGYKPAGVISGGQMKEDYGGGVSQVSTTLFNAAFFAGFDLDEHRAHSRYISRYPEGRETTLDFDSIDLKFTNNSDTPVVLDMSLSGGEVHARVLGVKTVEVEAGASDRFAYTSPGTVRESGPRCTPQSPAQGWSIRIDRTIRDAASGKVLSTDDFTTVYRPVNRVICEDDD